MTAHVRSFRCEDAEAAARMLREVVPEYLITAPLLVHWSENEPERAHLHVWVAERDGDVVGWAEAQLRWAVATPGVGWLWAAVGHADRRRGVGSRLLALGEEHLRTHGAWKLTSMVGDDEGGAFAARRGFVETRRERLSALDAAGTDLSELPRLEAAKAAEGFRVAPLRALLDRPRDAFELYAEAEYDMPSAEPRARLGYEEWKHETWENPLLDHDASTVVLEADRPVSFAWLLVDREGGRAEHELTGTLRSHRGRGLALLAKLAAVRWCAANGIRTLLTGNDTENAPMLAINDRLGYRPSVVRSEIAKEIATPP